MNIPTLNQARNPSPRVSQIIKTTRGRKKPLAEEYGDIFRMCFVTENMHVTMGLGVKFLWP